MLRKALFVIACVSLVTGLLAAPATAQEFRGITCGLEGTAKLKPGLTSTDGEYKVAFTGTLNDCQTTGDATGGTVKAKALANGNCAHAVAEGKATIKWDNGNTTAVSFSTEDVGALVVLTYEVVKSNEPAAATGDQGIGLLAFQADPTACETEEGITKADFVGQVGSGSPS